MSVKPWTHALTPMALAAVISGALVPAVIATTGEGPTPAGILLDRLRDPKAETRAAAARALAESRPIERGVLEALANALPDPSDQVRTAARAALEDLSRTPEFDGIAAGLDRGPQPLSQAPPKYPRHADKKEVEGTVVVGLSIDVDGKVVDARVLESVPGLDEAAVKAAKTWLFAPALKNGRIVPTKTHVPILFRRD